MVALIGGMYHFRMLIPILLLFLTGDLLSPDLRPSGFRSSGNFGSNSGGHRSLAVRTIYVELLTRRYRGLLGVTV